MRTLDLQARPSLPSRHGLVILLVAAFCCVIAAAVAHVSLRLGVIRLGYAIGQHTRERRTLEEEQRRLRLELSFLRSPSRIERLARDKLHMERPDSSRIRVVQAPPAPAPRATR